MAQRWYTPQKYKTYAIEIDGSDLEGVGDYAGRVISGQASSEVLDFEARIKAMLDSIETHKTGQQVFSNLAKGQTVTIVPFTKKDAESKDSSGQPFGACNAVARPSWWKNGSIHIDPLTWKPGAVCATSFGGGAGSDTDEILLHEMLHSYRQLAGHEHDDPFNVAPDKQYTTIEDFWTIVVTNIYMSEKGKTILRRDHVGFAPLPPKWSTSAGFLSDPDLLKWSWTILRQEEPLLRVIDTSIAASTPFNPFHELLTNPVKYPAPPSGPIPVPVPTMTPPAPTPP